MVASQRINPSPAPTQAPTLAHTCRECDGCGELLDFEFIGECPHCETNFGNVCCECEQERDWDELPLRCDADAVDGVRQLCCYCDPNWERELTCEECGDECEDVGDRLCYDCFGWQTCERCDERFIEPEADECPRCNLSFTRE